MTQSSNLSLPYLEAGQAQKHVTHNEALRALDALVQLAVAGVSNAPPPAPAEGERRIVGTSPSGAFAGRANAIAAFQDGAWAFYAPKAGWRAWNAASEALLVFTGAAWEAAASGGGGSFDPEDVDYLYINGADPEGEDTKLAVRSNDVLLHAVETAHEPAGSGDVRLQISKEDDAGKTASVFFSRAFSGRAEFGLIGGDAFKLKVSPDGTSWIESMVFDPATGTVSFPQGIDPPPAAAGGMPRPPPARLSLESGVAVSLSDQLAKTTVYLVPFNGAGVPVFNGSGWSERDLSAGASLPLDSNSGHTGYHQSGKNFDVFYAFAGGSCYFGTGPAWTSDTARSAALALKNGLWVNAAPMTLRHGTGSGDTATVPTEQGLYLGTFRASANGQTQIRFGSVAAGGGDAWFGLWNAYHRVGGAFFVGETADWWSYQSTTIRAVNGSNTMRVSMVRGLNIDVVDVGYRTSIYTDTTTTGGMIGFGLDSTSSAELETRSYARPGTIRTFLATHYRKPVGLGFHYLQAVEAAENATNQVYFYGDAGVPAYMQAGVHGTLLY